MSKSETLLAFEAALKNSKELQEKFAAAMKRIAENKEAASDAELLVKAAAEVGFTLNTAEMERLIAQMQEISDEDLSKVAGENWSSDYSLYLPFTCVNVVVGETAD